MRLLAPLALVAAIALAPGAVRAQPASFPPPLGLRVPKPPTLGTGDNGSFLVYELHVTNFSNRPMTLRQVDVTTGDAARRTLLTLADTALQRRIARPGTTINIPDRPTIGAGLRAVVYIWVPVSASGAPTSLSHHLTVAVGTGDSARVETLDGPSVPVARGVAEIGPPLRGGPWLAANGPSNESGHRRALIVVGGVPAIAQRFAIDYVKMGTDNSTHTGDPLKNENYHAEGNDALAVGDGRVVEVKDSIPENVPGMNSRAVPITLETVGGNHVIIDLGNGRYAFYAHLKPGSIRVKVGDQVRRGQVVGLVGNTGNSTEPHLHFHISDAPSPLGSEGLPYAMDAFEIVGRCGSFTNGCDRAAAKTVRRQVPLDGTLVRFP
jgi:murein DD-endopeptidase MepM/ murein hydrolase activator NlpD